MISFRQGGWAEAGITLGNDPTAVVLCPDCGRHHLEVTDLQAEGGYERRLKCPGCGSSNFLLFRSTPKA
jgi:predicted nucleic-acid-binding Zn-ribbon protein